MIFITAESIEGESIFSEQDRLLEIHIPKMTMELAKYKNALTTMKQEEMASIAQAFAKAVMRDVKKTKELIQGFVQDYQVPEWVDVTTRLGHHIMIILLSEYLFRMLICKGDDRISHLSDLRNALGKKAMSILDKKYAEAKKLPFIRDPLAWALYHTWREFDDGKIV